MPSVTLIASLPKFTTPEEHATIVASTPESFGDIPPVVRHTEENVTVALDPPLEGFTATQGTLYVLTSVLAFMSPSGIGFQIEYPAITLHAVSRRDTGPLIYCQLDESYGTERATSTDNDNDFTDMRELTITPLKTESLEIIFESLSRCASLHPDPDSEDEADGAGLGFDDAVIDFDPSSTTFETFTGDEDEELSEVGRAALAHLESIIYDPHNFRPGENEEENREESTADVTEMDVQKESKDEKEAP